MNEMILERPLPYEFPREEQKQDYFFVSYSHGDEEIVLSDLRILKENGARFWYDKGMHKGQDWMESMKCKIFDPHCRGVIFYVSPNSCKSDAILKEVDITLEKASEFPETFSYASVNIGEQNAFDILKSVEVEEHAFLKLLTTFNQNRLFIKRSGETNSHKHIPEFTELLMEWGTVDVHLCRIERNSMFTVSEYQDGLQIVRYDGNGNDIKIPAEINGKKVICIGLNAFLHKTNIQRVVIQEGVQIIDDFCFSGCKNLQQISLPNSLEIIGYEAFRDCENLTGMIIPYNVSDVGEYCFYKCFRLRSIAFLSTDSLVIRFAAFSECYALEEVGFQDTELEIDSYAFNNCKALSSITLPPRTKKFGVSVFFTCDKLEVVYLLMQKAIDANNLFARCHKLKKIVIKEENVESYFSNETWAEYSPLMKAKIKAPTYVRLRKDMITWVGSDHADAYRLKINNTTCDTGEDYYSLDATDEMDSISVQVKAVCSDDNPQYISSDYCGEVHLKHNVAEFQTRTEGNQCILESYNGNRDTVKIPDSVTVIGKKAFYNKDTIKALTLSDSVTVIENEAFFRCKNLENIEFGTALRTIGIKAFLGIGIKSLVLPESIELLDEQCFARCNNLKVLEIRSVDTKANDRAFYRCINLRKVLLPKAFPALYSGMFRGCTELSDINLTKGLKSISAGSISYITKLNYIHVPETVELIDPNAFVSTYNCKAVSVDASNAFFYDDHGVLIDRRTGELIYYPPDKEDPSFTTDGGVHLIGEASFTDSEFVETILLSTGVSEIGAHAFQRCSKLKKITMTGDIERIGDHAFANCAELSEMVLLSGCVPFIGKRLLSGLAENFRFIIPRKMLRNYQQSSNWNAYLSLFRVIEKENEER